jgi:hypothetical protein
MMGIVGEYLYRFTRSGPASLYFISATTDAHDTVA